MKAYDACKLAYACGLMSTYEAYNNVLLHATSLFPYEKVAEEVDELKAEIDQMGDRFIFDVFPDISKE